MAEQKKLSVQEILALARKQKAEAAGEAAAAPAAEPAAAPEAAPPAAEASAPVETKAEAPPKPAAPKPAGGKMSVAEMLAAARAQGAAKPAGAAAGAPKAAAKPAAGAAARTMISEWVAPARRFSRRSCFASGDGDHSLAPATGMSMMRLPSSSKWARWPGRITTTVSGSSIRSGPLSSSSAMAPPVRITVVSAKAPNSLQYTGRVIRSLSAVSADRAMTGSSVSP